MGNYLLTKKIRITVRHSPGTCKDYFSQLRDHYASLDDLCRSENLERSAIESSLASVDYVYDPDTNQFT